MTKALISPGMTGGQAAAQISYAQSLAAQIIPKAQINTPGGVNGLDKSGNSLAPVNTTGNVFAQSVMSNGYQAAIPQNFPGNGWTDDANYHYVCVAANHWRRVALGDF